jgi:hypothetical protein
LLIRNVLSGNLGWLAGNSTMHMHLQTRFLHFLVKENDGFILGWDQCISSNYNVLAAWKWPLVVRQSFSFCWVRSPRNYRNIMKYHQKSEIQLLAYL